VKGLQKEMDNNGTPNYSLSISKQFFGGYASDDGNVRVMNKYKHTDSENLKSTSTE